MGNAKRKRDERAEERVKRENDGIYRNTRL
jgi:hypothetical protein